MFWHFFPSHGSLSQIQWCVKLLLFVWQKFSIHFRLQSNPMVREKLALPLSSIAQWFISNPMDRKILFWHFFPSHGSLYQSRWIGKKLLFQDSSITEGYFSASMVKQGKWIPSTKKYSQRGWSERPGSSLESRGFPSWQKLSKRRWCLKPKAGSFHSIRFKKACPKMGYSHPTSFFIPSDMKRFLI